MWGSPCNESINQRNPMEKGKNSLPCRSTDLSSAMMPTYILWTSFSNNDIILFSVDVHPSPYNMTHDIIIICWYLSINDSVIRKENEGFLPHQVKVQYLQVKNTVDTSIKRYISGQFSTLLKGCMYIMFDMVDTTFSYGRALIICLFLQDFFKVNSKRK